MQNRFRIYRWGELYYLEDVQTGRQKSLRTRDLIEAEKLKEAENTAPHDSALAVAIGVAYFANRDPELKTRTWTAVFDEFIKRGKKQSTCDRRVRALRSPDFDSLCNMRFVETTSAHFEAVFAQKKTSVIHSEANGATRVHSAQQHHALGCVAALTTRPRIGIPRSARASRVEGKFQKRSSTGRRDLNEFSPAFESATSSPLWNRNGLTFLP